MPFDGSPVANEFVALLRTARDLITSPRRHIKSTLFKDKNGNMLDPIEHGDEIVVPEGTYSMCMEGALIVAGLKREQRGMFNMYFNQVHGTGHVDYNDRKTHTDTLRAFDKVIDHIANRT